MGVFNGTVIPRALVGYEMIKANSPLRASLATTISYPTRTRGINVKCRSEVVTEMALEDGQVKLKISELRNTSLFSSPL